MPCNRAGFTQAARNLLGVGYAYPGNENHGCAHRFCFIDIFPNQCLAACQRAAHFSAALV